MDTCKCDMLIGVYESECGYRYMHVIVCGVCADAYSDNNDCVHVGL